MIKRKTKEIIILGVILAIVCMLGTTVNAESTSSFKAAVTPTEKTLKPGEEITITLAVSDIDMGEDGINTLEGTIEYDKEIFEEVKSSNIQSKNNWSTTYNDENSTLNGKFLAVNLSAGIKEDTEIFSITLKAKSEIESTANTEIKFVDITSNDGTDLINVGTKKVKITVEVEEEVTPPETNENNTIENNTVENNTVNTGNQTTNQTTNQTNTNGTDKTLSNTNLPKAGKSTAIIVGILIISIIGIATGMKNRYLKGIK